MVAAAIPNVIVLLGYHEFNVLQAFAKFDFFAGTHLLGGLFLSVPAPFNRLTWRSWCGFLVGFERNNKA
jgi:hypothetical protein